jgi:uncharacterized protein (DUF111 family)
MPLMEGERIGYGAGMRNWPDRPNVPRLLIGKSSDHVNGLVEQLTLLSCNIDDMNPQWWALTRQLRRKRVRRFG